MRARDILLKSGLAIRNPKQYSSLSPRLGMRKTQENTQDPRLPALTKQYFLCITTKSFLNETFDSNS